jgi:hypothetical protein
MDDRQPDQLAAVWVDRRPVTYIVAALWRQPWTAGATWSVVIVEASPAIPSGEFELGLKTGTGVAFKGRARLEHAGERAIKTDLIKGVGPLVDFDGEPGLDTDR